MSVDVSTKEAPTPFSGLATYFSIPFSPTAAFERLNRVPTWGWAAIIGIILTLVGFILLSPAQMHMTAVITQQRISEMPADQQAQARASMASVANISKIFIYIVALLIPWFTWLISAVVFLIGAALGGGEAKFSRAWVLAVNTYVIVGIAFVINGIIMAFRDPTTVNSQIDIMALPSLALLVHGNVKLAAFLYSFNVLYLWYAVVAIIGMERYLKVSRTVAIATVIIYNLLSALLGMASAR